MPRTELEAPLATTSEVAGLRPGARGNRQRWNRSRPSRNAFTIDVEDYYHVSALASAIPRDTLGRRANRALPRAPTGCWPCSTRSRIKGTFFVLGWVADNVPQLVKRIAALGHEVACHGYSHELIYRQTPGSFRRGNPAFEDAAGRPHRHAGNRLSRRQLLDHAAFALGAGHADRARLRVRLVDFPGASRSLWHAGCRRARRVTSMPRRAAASRSFRCRRRRSARCASRCPAAGISACCRIGSRAAGCAASTSAKACRSRSTSIRGKSTSISRGSDVGLVSRFRHYTNLSKCEARLRRLLDDFRFTTMRNVLRARGLLSS